MAPFVLLAGLAALYIPTFIDLARGAWRDDAYAHGPLILAVSAVLAWRARGDLALVARPAGAGGLTFLVAGVAIWLLGRTQGLVMLEAGSLLPVAIGATLLAWGVPGLRRLAFPIAFLAFYVPLPGFALDALTAPLKEWVSAAVAYVLAISGHAVERSGVVLSVDGHAMLVADACSGLNSLVSLAAMALLYGHLRRAPLARRAALVLAILPIALLANVLRVLALAFIVTHFGEEAAGGAVHTVLGLGVFMVALALLLAIDRLGGEAPVQSIRARPQLSSDAGAPLVSTVTPLIACAVMVGAAAAAPAMRPVAEAAAFDLEAAIPAAFGGWHVDPEEVPVSPAPDVQANLARLYRQIVARTYVDASGQRMMITAAYGGDQSDALKAHRQEVCYRAQGFEIREPSRGTIAAAGREIPVMRFVAVQGERSEPVTYWFTMGDRVVLGRLDRLRVQLTEGLQGRVPGGMLVRVSSIDTDPARARALQARFVAALLAAAGEGATRLAGAAREKSS